MHNCYCIAALWPCKRIYMNFPSEGTHYCKANLLGFCQCADLIECQINNACYMLVVTSFVSGPLENVKESTVLFCKCAFLIVFF